MITAQLGLDPSGVLGSAYLVPFWNTHKGRYEAQLIVGYRGLIDLARRSGDIVGVEAHVVREKDSWKYAWGVTPVLEHIRSLDADPGKPTAAYAVVRLRDGPPLIDIMSYAEIEAIRKRSRAAGQGPWVTDWDEMAKKTVTRRALKYAPMSVDAARALAVEDRAEAGEGDISDIVDLPPLDEDGGTAAAGTRSEQLASRIREAREKAASAAATPPGPEPPAGASPATGPTPDPGVEGTAATPGTAAPAEPTTDGGGRGAGGSPPEGAAGQVAETAPAAPPEPWKVIEYQGERFVFYAREEWEAHILECPHPSPTLDEATKEMICARCGGRLGASPWGRPVFGKDQPPPRRPRR